jgi:hypothetical protein
MRFESDQLPITEPPHEDTCWYLGSLLERLGRSEQLFTYQDERMTIRPLALLYSDAIEASNDRERCLMLQQLGDMALFLGALFPERFARHGLQPGYFIGMGGSAYDYLAPCSRKDLPATGSSRAISSAWAAVPTTILLTTPVPTATSSPKWPGPLPACWKW